MIYRTTSKNLYLYTAKALRDKKRSIVYEEISALEKEFEVASKIIEFLKKNHDDKILIYRKEHKLKEIKKILVKAKHKYKDLIDL